MEDYDTEEIKLEEFSNKMDYVTSDEWFKLDEDERRIEFELSHFQKYNRFANANFQKVYEEYAEALKNHGDAVEETLAEIEEETKNIIPYDKIAKALGKEAAGLMLQNQFNMYLAREIVANSVKGGVDFIGRRGAVVVADQTFKLTATQAATNSVKNMRFVNALPSIGAAIGENLAELAIDAAGVKNHVVKNAAKLGGAVAGGAATGAAIGAMGGPAGVAAGAMAGAATYATGEAIQGLLNTGFGQRGPDDNWVYIEIGELKGTQISIGTYKSNDSIYFKTYWTEYRTGKDHFVMSAGQPQNESFQVTIWHDSETVHHFDRVYYGDFIRVYCCGKLITVKRPDRLNKKGKAARMARTRFAREKKEKIAKALGRYGIMHAKGRYWGDEAGRVELYDYRS